MAEPWQDVCRHPEGGVVIAESLPGALRATWWRTTGPQVLWTTPVPTDHLRFVRVAVSPFGLVAGVGIGGPDGGPVFLVDAGGAVPHGHADFEQGVAITHDGTDFVVYAQRTATTYTRNGQSFPMRHSSQGFTDVFPDGRIVFGDETVEAFQVRDRHDVVRTLWRRLVRGPYLVGDCDNGIGVFDTRAQTFFVVRRGPINHGIRAALDGPTLLLVAKIEGGEAWRGWLPPWPAAEGPVEAPTPDPTPAPTPDSEPVPIPEAPVSTPQGILDLLVVSGREIDRRFPGLRERDLKAWSKKVVTFARLSNDRIYRKSAHPPEHGADSGDTFAWVPPGLSVVHGQRSSFHAVSIVRDNPATSTHPRGEGGTGPNEWRREPEDHGLVHGQFVLAFEPVDIGGGTPGPGPGPTDPPPPTTPPAECAGCAALRAELAGVRAEILRDLADGLEKVLGVTTALNQRIDALPAAQVFDPTKYRTKPAGVGFLKHSHDLERKQEPPA